MRTVALVLAVTLGMFAAEAPPPGSGATKQAAPRYVVFGMPDPATMKTGELLLERYGVELALGGCVVDDESLRATEAANAAVGAALTAKHGRDVIAECFADAAAAVAAGR